VIGHGHFGMVRVATKRNAPKGPKYAVKSLTKEKIKTELHLLKREVAVLRIIDHPNVIKFHQVYEDEKYVHIVMEYCSGGELFERIIKKENFGEAEACRIMYKVLHAVNHLHDNQICHRDLKPENFLFENKDDDAELKIIDFGLSNKFGDEQED